MSIFLIFLPKIYPQPPWHCHSTLVTSLGVWVRTRSYAVDLCVNMWRVFPPITLEDLWSQDFYVFSSDVYPWCLDSRVAHYISEIPTAAMDVCWLVLFSHSLFSSHSHLSTTDPVHGVCLMKELSSVLLSSSPHTQLQYSWAQGSLSDSKKLSGSQPSLP